MTRSAVPLLLLLAATLPCAEGDAVAQAQRMLADGKRAEARNLLETRQLQDPNDERARALLLSMRIADLESEMRSMVSEQAERQGALAASPDYEEAKARSVADVRARLEIVEYHLARQDYAHAVEACNAILRDHQHDPATTRIKYRILNTMVERERAALQREREYRSEESLADSQAKGVIPREKAKIARTVWTFDEDVQEADRLVVKKQLQERVTLNYDGVKVGEILKPLFAVAGVNYVILDEAIPDKTMTLHVVDEPVENVLATVSKLVKVRYQYHSRTVFIASEDGDVLVSEIIRLESGLTDVQTEQPMPAFGGDSGSGSAGSPGSPAVPGGGARPPQAAQNRPQAQPGGAQGSSDLERMLDKAKDLIEGWPDKGTIFLDRKSNTLYVRSTPAAIAELKRLLRSIDYNNVQVLIEARFVEVAEGASRDLGVDWTMAGSSGGFVAGAPNPTLPSTLSPIAIGGTSGLAGSLFYSPLSSFGISMKIQALESENKAQSLAEPRILTLNNAAGKIMLKQQYWFIQNYQVQSYSNSSATNTNNSNVLTQTNSVATPEWKSEDYGISLWIRPSVARNSDIITLDLRPSVKQPLGSKKSDFIYQPSPGAENIKQPIEQPEFRERSLATYLHVKNGQTVILGGLSNETESKDESGVPGMRRVPLLGGLFQSQHKTLNRSNLMIFVTAHIIDPSGAKVSDEIQRLRETASVTLSEPARSALAEQAVKQGAAPPAAPAGGQAPAADDRGPVKKGR